MPLQFANEVSRIAEAGGIVAVVAAMPIIVVGWALGRRFCHPFIPSWMPKQAGWTLLDWVFLFFINSLFGLLFLQILSKSGFFRVVYGPDFPSLPDLTNKTVNQLGGLWAQMMAVPLVVGIGLAIRIFLHQVPWKFDLRTIGSHIGFGALAALVVTPIVYAVFVLALYIGEQLGDAAEDHPLSQLGAGNSFGEQLFFIVVVCGVVPLIEEFLFRGVLLRWACSTWWKGAILVGIAGVFAVQPSMSHALKPGPIGFVALLAMWYFLVIRYGRLVWHKFPTHTIGGIISTATLFAAVHSAVWPSPVPLFFLGCALGYVVARSGGITAAVVLHGLFNAVSTVYLIQGGAGLG